jgi:Protein of unknown function (DUF3106)
MFRSFCYGAILAMILATGLAAQPSGRLAPKKGGPLPLPRPGAAIIERWSRMTPEERSRALEKLPAERRQKIEDQLERYQNLSPEEREQLHFRAELFNRLPPERQDIARRVFRQFNQLPPERQAIVRGELQNLRAMPPPDRRARIQSEDFRDAYNNREQMVVRQLFLLMSPIQ